MVTDLIQQHVIAKSVIMLTVLLLTACSASSHSDGSGDSQQKNSAKGNGDVDIVSTFSGEDLASTQELASHDKLVIHTSLYVDGGFVDSSDVLGKTGSPTLVTSEPAESDTPELKISEIVLIDLETGEITRSEEVLAKQDISYFNMLDGVASDGYTFYVSLLETHNVAMAVIKYNWEPGWSENIPVQTQILRIFFFDSNNGDTRVLNTGHKVVSDYQGPLSKEGYPYLNLNINQAAIISEAGAKINIARFGPVLDPIFGYGPSSKQDNESKVEGGPIASLDKKTVFITKEDFGVKLEVENESYMEWIFAELDNGVVRPLLSADLSVDVKGAIETSAVQFDDESLFATGKTSYKKELDSYFCTTEPSKDSYSVFYGGYETFSSAYVTYTSNCYEAEFSGLADQPGTPTGPAL